jgi:amidase
MSVATATDLWRMSARELAEAIRSKQASSQEVIEAHLRRIEAVNGSVNAVTVLADAALEAAKAADRAVAAGDELKPLHGIPFTVKENIDLAGTATTQGVPALASAVPEIDAPVSGRVRTAGPSDAPTAPTSGSAGIPTTRSTVRPSTPGTARGRPGARAAARRWRSPPA